MGVGYSLMRKCIVRGLFKTIHRTRGNCVTFNCKRIAKAADLPTKPVTLTIVRSVIDELVDRDLVGVWKRGSGKVRYIVTRDSPLWKVAKSGDLDELLRLLGE